MLTAPSVPLRTASARNGQTLLSYHLGDAAFGGRHEGKSARGALSLLGRRSCLKGDATELGIIGRRCWNIGGEARATNHAEIQHINETEDTRHRIGLLWASMNAGRDAKLGPVNQGRHAESMMPSLQIADNAGGFDAILE